jgi:hypothetical protein
MLPHVVGRLVRLLPWVLLDHAMYTPTLQVRAYRAEGASVYKGGMVALVGFEPTTSSL